MDRGEEIWHSIAVYAKEDENGNLVIRVLVFHPDWDEALQIACIKSRPSADNILAMGDLKAMKKHVNPARVAQAWRSREIASRWRMKLRTRTGHRNLIQSST